MPLSLVELIAKKRDGAHLSGTEIQALVDAVTSGQMPDYQTAALLMAIYLRGLNARETSDLTQAMVSSGETVDLTAIQGFKADKHSTGGVGDKVTLVLAPLVASAGINFPKLSGRGLGHTGGTLDKLESIPNMRVDLSIEEFIGQVRAIGVAVSGQTAELVPADGIIYGLRDQTATVGSLPLIASSIMSKKLAAGSDGIVLDVKCGRGAFMKTAEEAHALARQMVAIGVSGGKKTRALVTSMDNPLGLAVGNALEVRESIDTLHGRGPGDVEEEVLSLGAEIVIMAGGCDGQKVSDVERARELLQIHLRDGSAAAKLRDMISMQGGDERVVDDPGRLPTAGRVITIESSRGGFVQAIDALAIGEIAMALGAGRRSKGDAVSASAGVVLRAKPELHGGKIGREEPLLDLHFPGDRELPVSPDEIERLSIEAFTIGDEPPRERAAVLARVTEADIDLN